MKKIIVLFVILVLGFVYVAPGFAGVTVTITDTGSGSVIKTFNISTAKVDNLQSMASDTSKTSMTYLTEAVGDVFIKAKAHEDAKVGGIPSELKAYVLANEDSLCVLAGCP